MRFTNYGGTLCRHYLSQYGSDNSQFIIRLQRETSYIDNVTSSKMDEDQSHMTERIINLTLEIIYLLTGEVRRILGGHMTSLLSLLIKHRPDRRGEEDSGRSHDITLISINNTQT